MAAVKHPPSAELAGFPEKAKDDKCTIAKSHPDQTPKGVALVHLPPHVLRASGWGSRGLPRRRTGSRAHSTAKRAAQSSCQACPRWAEGCPPRGDGPAAQSGAGRAPAGSCTSLPSPEHQPVPLGTVTQLATEGSAPASKSGTDSQSSATNSKKIQVGTHRRCGRYVTSVVQKHSILFNCRMYLNCTLPQLSSSEDGRYLPWLSGIFALRPHFIIS